MQLPAKPVTEFMLDEHKCFALEKDTKVADSRRLVFLDNGSDDMIEFRN